jgi:hypothetical protein
LVVGGEFEELVADGIGCAAQVGVSAGAEDVFVDGFQERQGDGVAADADDLSGLDVGGVFDEDACEFVESLITHGVGLSMGVGGLSRSRGYRRDAWREDKGVSRCGTGRGYNG